MDPDTDVPEILVHPPLLFGVALLASLVLTWLWPIGKGWGPIAVGAGFAIAIGGLALGLSSARALRRAGTQIDPRKPTAALVTSGPYGVSRHPVYVALGLAYLGLTLALDSPWGLVIAVPLFATMHVGAVLREERYLARKFGAAYQAYRARVRLYF